MHFTYDALGRRLSKRFGAEYTQWLWDGDVPLHEWKERLPEHYDVETGESFADLDAAVASLVDATNRDFTTWLFEPDGHRPMAKLSGRERLSIITDHLGTPVAAYDGSGVQRFSRSLDIYGGELAGEGSPSIPFRYPGQYFDVETGLSYNRFRYYDPGEGVYLSVDPIGLAGGNPTLYGYVGDVNGEVDVFGLNTAPEKAAAWEFRFNTQIPAHEKYNAAKGKLAKVAERNSWTKSPRHTRMNGRDVYFDTRGNLYGADTQHGRFEYHDKKGNHLGEFNIDGEQTKPIDKTRKLKCP